MAALIDDDSSHTSSLTRRERRIARSRSRRTAALVGWFGYGIGVFVVVSAAAWLAVRGDTPVVPQPTTEDTVVARVVVVEPTTSTTTASVSPAPVAPVADPALPTPTTTSTTAPVLSAAVTPAPEPSTP